MRKVVINVLFLFLMGVSFMNIIGADPPLRIAGSGGYSGECVVRVASNHSGDLDNNDGVRSYNHRWSFVEEGDGSWTGVADVTELAQYGKPVPCNLNYKQAIDCVANSCDDTRAIINSGSCHNPSSSSQDHFSLSDIGNLWDVYGVSCFDDWWCQNIGPNPNYPEYKNYGSLSKYTGKWDCSNNAYGLETTINFSGVEYIGPLCKKDNQINSTYTVSIDAIDDLSSKTDADAEAKVNPQPTIFKKNKDIEIKFSVKSPKYDSSLLESDATIEEKYSCAMPDWFEVEFSVGAMYYDDIINVDDLINKTREKLKNEVLSKIAFLIKDDGGDFNDYFLSTQEIKTEMIQHGWTTFKEYGDSIFITDTIRIYVQLDRENKEVRVMITELAQGEPVNPDAYKNAYRKGTIQKQISKHGKDIVVSKGDVSLFLYDELLETLIKKIPQKIENVEMFHGNSFERIEKNGKLRAYVHLIPTIEENTLSKLDSYIEEKEFCCQRTESKYEIPEVDVGLCPQGNVMLLGGVGEIHIDVKSYIAGIDVTSYTNDGSIFLRTELFDTEYDKNNEDIRFCNFKCGVPDRIYLTITLAGRYYDTGDINLFKKIREKFISQFPLSKIKYFFRNTGKTLLHNQQNVTDATEDGDVEWSTDDSQWVYEVIRIKMENKNGVITLTFSDDINFNSISGKKLANPKPLPKLSNTVIISRNNLGGDIVFSSLVNSIISSVSQLEHDTSFEGTQPGISESGQPYTLTFEKVFNIDDLLWVASARKDSNCCFQTNEGLSLYYFRDPRNYSIEGIGYIARADAVITQNVTKSFIETDENKNYKIYRIGDEDLDLINYTIVDTANYYVNLGGENILSYYSSDDLFKINFSENPQADITIETIDITGWHFDNLDVQEIELPEEVFNLEKVMLSAEKYISGSIAYPSFLSDFMKWVYP